MQGNHFESETGVTTLPERGGHFAAEFPTNLPMHVNLGSDAVKKMLDFDVLYLMFRSGVSGDGHPSEIETARLALAPLQAKWNEIIKSKLSN